MSRARSIWGVWTDADGRVFESDESNNTRLIDLGTIDPPDPGTVQVPDLVLVEVDAPTEAYSGQPFALSWTVRNDGDPTPRNWYDQVYLSLDQVLDLGSDISLGHVYHSSLPTDESYTKTQAFTIPRGLSGPFYVFVFTDRGNYLNESDELNNIDYDRTSMLVNLLPPADLVVGTITVPSNASPGVNATITYTIENQGDDAALGSWYDSIYISADDTWDISDAFFGRVHHVGNVAGGASYSHSLTAPLPGVLPGEYHVIIRSDIRNQIPESDETNNIGASLDRVEIDAQLLPLGEPQSGTLAQGLAVYYKTEVLEAGETVRLHFDGAEDAYSELYVRYGAMPSRNQYDHAANQPFVSDQQIILPVEQTGVYYVMAYGTVAGGAPEYTISADIIPFSILDVQANRVGNTGNATVKVSGARFNENTVFYLEDAIQHTISARETYLQDSATAFATFDLFQVPAGVYSVGAFDPDQQTATLLHDSLTVVVGTGFNIDILGAGPAVVAPNRNYRFDVLFGNDGDGDAMAPLLVATGVTNTPLGFSPGDLRTGTPLQILGSPEEGPLDILRPGSLNAVSIYYRSGSAAQGVNVRVEPFTHDDRTVISTADWEQIKASVKPAAIPAEDWDAFWARTQSRIGDTWGDYVQFLNRLATVLSVPGQPLRDVRGMFEAIYDQNPDYLPSYVVSGQLLDSDTGAALEGVELLAYRLLPGGATSLADTVRTDAEGRFALDYLLGGDYELAIGGDHFFDQNRDLSVDGSPPALTLEDQDVDGLALYAIPPSDVTPPQKLERPQILVDAAGVPHMFWLLNGRVWHAWNNGTGWVGAEEVPGAEARDFSVDAAANLIDGTQPGVVLTFQGNGGVNGTDILYSVGRWAQQGQWEWSLPASITEDDIADSEPRVVVDDDGEMIVVYLKENEQIQDDSDLYYNQVNVNSSDLFFLQQVLDHLDLQAMQDFVALASSGNWSGGGEIELKGPAFLAKYGKIKFRLLFDGGYTADCTLDVSAAIEGRLGLEIALPGNTGASNRAYYVSGSGKYSGTWQAVGTKGNGRYELISASGSATVAGAVDFNVPLEQAVSFLPPNLSVPGTILLSFLRKAKIFSADFGVRVKGRIGGDFGWNGTNAPPFAWVAPDSATLVAEVGADLYGKASAGRFKARINGGVTVESRLLPSFQFLGVTGQWGVTINIPPWFVLNYSSDETDIIGSGVDFVGLNELDLPPGVSVDFAYDPDASVGTGNTYFDDRNASVLSNVAEDLYDDEDPSIAKGPNGELLMAWTKDLGAGIGSAIVVSQFGGTSWSAPVEIPGSRGGAATPSLIFDADGHPLVLWSSMDLSSLTPESTVEEVVGVLETTDLFFSKFNGTQWSAASTAYAASGTDENPQLSRTAEGTIIATWTNATDVLTQLMVSTWTGDGWSQAEAIANGEILGRASLGIVNGATTIFWSQDLDPEPELTEAVIFTSVYDSGWSAPQEFTYQLQTPSGVAPAESTFQVQGLLDGLAIPMPTPPDECLKCEKIDTVYQGSDEGCGFSVEFDEENCKKIITYKPCVPPPVDPNDILGPIGYGEENWIPADQQLDYMIRFENDPVFAQAPAQKVVVTQQLDDDLDWRTFRLGDFGFGGLVFEVPPNRAFHSTRIDLTEERGYFVDFTAGVNIQTGEAFWTLVTIDPETGEQPLDPLVGFLAINDDEGAGEGYLSYSIRAKRTAATGDVIDAEARIVFDTEAPIDTPPIFNTLDAVKPQSAVEALPASVDAVTFQVTWTGSDDEGGSGLAAFNVFVSEDDGPFVPWLLGTQLTTAEFLGGEGRRYAFYSVAFDNAGNQENATRSGRCRYRHPRRHRDHRRPGVGRCQRGWHPGRRRGGDAGRDRPSVLRGRGSRPAGRSDYGRRRLVQLHRAGPRADVFPGVRRAGRLRLQPAQRRSRRYARQRSRFGHGADRPVYRHQRSEPAMGRRTGRPGLDPRDRMAGYEWRWAAGWGRVGVAGPGGLPGFGPQRQPG
jgi:hypothetical protein